MNANELALIVLKRVDAGRWINDEQALLEYDVAMDVRRAIAALEAVQVEPASTYRALDAQLGRCAMHFVDRAGDVHPGIDDAETICADFYRAMCAILAAPKVQPPSSAKPPAAQKEPTK